MRSGRLAAAALLATIALGAAAVWHGGGRSGGPVFSNAVVVAGFGGDLAPGARLCSGPVDRLAAFDRLRLSLASRATDPRRAVDPRLLVRVVGAGGATLAGPARIRLSAGDAARDFGDAALGAVPPGGPMRVCVVNAGSGPVRLWSGAGSAERAGETRIGRTRAAQQPELAFFDDPPSSLRSRLSEMVRRSAIWRSAPFGAWTAWALLGAFALGVPALLAFALLRASRDGDEPDAAARWVRFQREVEPALAARPRVHRFAAPPLLGPPDLAAAPVAVAVVGDGPHAERTRARLAEQTAPAAELLAGADPVALLGAAQSPHVLLVEAGDVLAPLALERFGQAIALAPDARLLTCDEDALDARGRRRDPRVRPGPSPDLLLAHDVAGAAICVAREAALDAASAAPLEPGAWRYDLALRLAGADGAGQAHLPALLVHRRAGAAPADPDAERRAVTRVLAPGASVADVSPGRRRVRRPLATQPHVEAIVLFRDKPQLLRRCVRSALERTRYERLSLRLVDNGSVEPETAELVRELARDPRVTTMADDRPFNFAALNNVAVAASDADVVVFLNNDTAVTDGDWVEGLLEEALRPEVGAVAPLLLYADGSVQHAGAAIGLHGYAGHPFAGLRPDAETPFGRATDGTRNWLAVTAACMMVERAKLDAVGGFDETFVVAGNDVDLCLRLTAAGHRSLCVPHVRMLHDESQSRGAHVDPGDFARSEARYGAFRTVGDPFYNPALTLVESTCALRAPGERVA